MPETKPAERDWKIEPVKRDVIVRCIFGYLGGKKTQITITDYDGETVWYRQKSFGYDVYSMTIVAFRIWSAGARIIKRGDAPGATK